MISRDASTVCKGFAIIIIMCAHVVGTWDDAFLTIISPRYLTPLGGVGVAIFLFLSGYGLQESFISKGLNGFWKRKMFRVIIPYLGWCVIIRPVGFLSPLSHSEDFPLLIRYWFIDYIIIWYVAFYVSSLLSKKYSVILLFVFSVMTFFIYESDLQAEQSLSFFLGVLYSNIKDQINIKNNKWFVVSCFFLSVGLLALILKQHPMIRELGETSVLYKLIQMCIKLPIALSIIIIITMSSIKEYKILYYSGMISYELYLIHMPFLKFLSSSYFNLVLFVLQSFVLSILINKLNNYVANKIVK